MDDGNEMSNLLLELHILPTVLVALIVPYLFVFFVPSKIREWKRLEEERKRSEEERKRLEELVVHRDVVDDDTVVEVSAIYIYPVKSLRAVSVPSATIDSLGLQGDRRLMLVRPSTSSSATNSNSGITHRFVTQRQCAALATITATLDDESFIVRLSTALDDDDGEIISISVDASPHRLLETSLTYRAGLWNDVVEVVDVGDAAAAFVHKVLEQKSPPEELVHGPCTFSNVRVVAMLPPVPSHLPPKGRKTDGRYVPPAAMVEDGTVPETALTDGFPILVTSEESLEELNRRLRLKGENTREGEDGNKGLGLPLPLPLPMSRFRPNIVVKGLKKPFDEDTWKAIQIIGDSAKEEEDGVILHLVKGCPRCKQSCTDQQTGERDVEPLETLRDFRALGKNGEDVYFGQNAVVQSARWGKKFSGWKKKKKKICVGDKVRILTTGDPVWDLDPVAAE